MMNRRHLHPSMPTTFNQECHARTGYPPAYYEREDYYYNAPVTSKYTGRTLFAGPRIHGPVFLTPATAPRKYTAGFPSPDQIPTGLNIARGGLGHGARLAKVALRLFGAQVISIQRIAPLGRTAPGEREVTQ